MQNLKIDINCDVGEGIGNEAKLLPLISSCNIACGGHAGDRNTIKKVATLAAKHDVKIGAHPSYPDKPNFGRVSMDISDRALLQTIKEQLQRIANVLKTEGLSLNHIKAHGALYNDIAKDSKLAKLFLDSISQYKDQCYIYVPFGSEIAKLALDNGFKIKIEAFADRNYNEDLSLVSRKLPNAVIDHPEQVLHHVLEMVKNHQVNTVENVKRTIKAATFCVHGDTPTALEILMYLSQELPKYQVEIAK